MFFMSVGSVVVRTWQEAPQWRQRPLPDFLAYMSPCLVILTASLLSTLTRPLLPRPAWARLVRACMVPRYLSFVLGLLLLAAGVLPPAPAIEAYHQRGASVMMAEGVVLAATIVVS